jgi:hypothetical protein
VVHPTIAVPTKDDSRLLGMQLQVAVFHPNVQSCLERLRLLQTATVADQSSRPGESHPQALTDPDLNVSAHPALTAQSGPDAAAANARRASDPGR